MGNLVFFQMSESIEEKISYLDDFRFVKTAPIGRSTGDQILQVHLRALHDNIGVFAFGVLIDLEHRDKVPEILDHVLTNLTDFFHVSDFLQKALILVIAFNLDLLNCIEFVIYECRVDVRVAPADFIHHFDVL